MNPNFHSMDPAPLRQLSGLLDFQGAARWGSFKRAAQALNKSPAAVSQAIAQLEQQLGFALFIRRVRAIELTPQGAELAAVLERSLGEIQRTVRALQQPEAAMQLTLHCTYSFAMKWLMPRLHRFHLRHPGVELQLQASDAALAGPLADGELALRYLRRAAGEDEANWLWTERLVVVYAPTLLQGRDARAQGDPGLSVLARYPLLYEGSPGAWLRLLDAIGFGGRRLDFAQGFSHAGLLVQAAVAGHGVALAPLSLASEDLAQGRLRWLRGLQLPWDYGYALLQAPGAGRLPRVRAMADWLREEFAGMSDAEP